MKRNFSDLLINIIKKALNNANKEDLNNVIKEDSNNAIKENLDDNNKALKNPLSTLIKLILNIKDYKIS